MSNIQDRMYATPKPSTSYVASPVSDDNLYHVACLNEAVFSGHSAHGTEPKEERVFEQLNDLLEGMTFQSRLSSASQDWGSGIAAPRVMILLFVCVFIFVVYILGPLLLPPLP